MMSSIIVYYPRGENKSHMWNKTNLSYQAHCFFPGIGFPILSALFVNFVVVDNFLWDPKILLSTDLELSIFCFLYTNGLSEYKY